MRMSIRFSSVALLICCTLTTAIAQNGSLLHAPAIGSVVQLPDGSTARPAGPLPLTSTGVLQSELGQLNQKQPGQAVGVAQAGQDDRPSVLLNEVSWTHQPAPPLRVFRENDVVTIRVDEITRVMAQGSANNRRRTLYEAILTDWINLSNFSLRPDPQVDGDPAVTAESNNNFRAQSTIQSRESMTFNIAATVVDIRPNGNLLLEARKTIRVNDNLWETSLSGLCRAQDIAPDNVVLSKDLIDLEIRKEDQGHLRDGYKRGWLQRFIDRFQPF